MIAGFLPLAFNPHAWIVAGVIAVCAFSGGFLKGWSASNAEQWHQVAIQAKLAAEQKERLAQADRQRAEKAESEAARLDATLESYLHETKASAPAACRMSPDELKRLQQLASARR
jgi:hypothetical protein